MCTLHPYWLTKIGNDEAFKYGCLFDYLQGVITDIYIGINVKK